MAATHVLDPADSPGVTPAQVELILSQIESLPTLPAVAARLLEMTLDDRSGTGEIAALVESDPSLSARILSLVRRSHIGSDAQTVGRAVVLLGADAVRSLVLGVQIFELFSHRAEQADSRFDRVGFWRHSLAVGCAARLIAEQRIANLARAPAARMGWPLARPEEAFVCGLLHDLGKVVFDACFPKSYDRVVERVEARHADIADVERGVFGVDHAVAGHRLALHWKLPTVIAECIWLHHHTPASTPTRIAFPDHVRLVQAADRLVRQMRIGYSGTHSLDPGPDDLDEETASKVMVELPEAIELRAEALGLREITSREVIHETLVRTNAELARLNAALTLANRDLERRGRTLDALCAAHRRLDGDCRHETVVQALVQAVRILAPDAGVGAFVSSPTRQLTLVGLDAIGQAHPRVEVLAAGAAGVVGALGSGPAPAEALLSPPLLDRFTSVFGQRSPLRCWPLSCQGRLSAGIVTGGPIADDLEPALRTIGAWAASWLNNAESAFVARQLTEELAEINRRFVSSQAEVARMRSLTMVGEMAAGAAHELNNPLAVISGRAQLLARDNADEETRKAAQTIADHAHRASAIVSELMEFAKPTPPRPTAWPLGPFLQEIRQAWLGKDALTAEEFTIELSDELPQVHADAAQIRLLFDELIRNAVEAMGDTSPRRLVVNCRGDVADDRLVISIEDNGGGMTPDVAERATDPFFSYRPAGRGRGLGLSRAARYAQINGGTIRLSSRVKEGTAVIVELPAAAAS
ncbi:MAG: HDOD domain-containing protein [Planctomycetes bacterium]|nr:HDOD domain-containing protein [Planctomycetota bacterium]